MSKMKFIKSLKFKLTVWYSLLFSIFSIVFILSINIWLDNYMSTNIATSEPNYLGRVMEDRPVFRDLTKEQIELVTESRLADLDTIKTVTLYSIIPVIVLSFAGGYTIASLGLKPLEKLNKEMKNKSMENLNQEIKFADKGDEISELIKSFNRMSRRLDESFEAQKEFVENASHELKTPLAIIQANLDTALEDGDIDKKELKKLLESSKTSIKFMNHLTEDLLLLSVLDQDIDVDEINITDILKRSVKQVEKLTKKKDINIKEEYFSSKVLTKGNSILFERAIMNILENAVKYSECNEIEIAVNKNDRNIILEIKDNGKGIPKEHLEKIFDRFYRIDKSRSRETGGSGLGLAITKQIIKKMEGFISVKSSKGKGTKFIIKLRV